MSRVVLAPDSFKGTADAPAVAAALAAGWRRERPGDDLVELPLADGGEGTLDALGAGLDPACRRAATVTGPDGSPHRAVWLRRPDGTAVVELARAAGLDLLDPLDARGATTAGVGELLAIAAADPGVRHVLLTLGGSATTDGGAGALVALGARFLDDAGHPLPPGGGALARLARLDLTDLRPGPADGLECLVDVTNPLLGPRGAAAVFGPQKGADPDDVAALDAALAHWATVVATAAPHPVDPDAPGAGAAGGTAFGLLSCWPGRMTPGARAVADAVGLADALAGADLVVTGEGRYDDQSADGKVVSHVVERAARRGGGGGGRRRAPRRGHRAAGRRHGRPHRAGRIGGGRDRRPAPLAGRGRGPTGGVGTVGGMSETETESTPVPDLVGLAAAGRPRRRPRRAPARRAAQRPAHRRGPQHGHRPASRGGRRAAHRVEHRHLGRRPGRPAAGRRAGRRSRRGRGRLPGARRPLAAAHRGRRLTLSGARTAARRGARRAAGSSRR